MSVIKELLQKVDIVDYINKYYPQIKLKKVGNVYQGYCPLPNHNEKTPSFTVFPDGKFKCFGCQAYGDIIDIVQEIEGLDKKQACEMIGHNIGMEIKFKPPNSRWEQYKDLMTAHNRRYWHELHNNPSAMNYLQNTRGLTMASINQFRLGLVPENESNFRNDLIHIGGRLAFPIHEQRQYLSDKDLKCIGMGYRTLSNQHPKYKNDKNWSDIGSHLSDTFVKSNILYGYAFAVNEIKQKGYAIVTEGYLDVISLHQAGIRNSVATMGTAFTEYQAKKLREITSTIICFYDADDAGLKAIESFLPMLLKLEFQVFFCIASNKLDPADICRENNYNPHIINIIIKEHTVPAMTYIINKYTSKYESQVTKLRLSAVRTITSFLENIQPSGDLHVYKDLMNKKLDIHS